MVCDTVGYMNELLSSLLLVLKSRIAGRAMLHTAAFMYAYYTIWAIVLVSPQLHVLVGKLTIKLAIL